MVVSSGMWPPSISSRTKSKSVCDADGKPTSISLTPTATRVWNMRSFLSASIGSISDWLPSRRSELSQIGALSITLLGQVRSGMSICGKARYFCDGFLSMGMAISSKRVAAGRQAIRDRRARGSATQSWTDQAQAAVLPLQDEGVGSVHGANPSVRCAGMASIV